MQFLGLFKAIFWNFKLFKAERCIFFAFWFIFKNSEVGQALISNNIKLYVTIPDSGFRIPDSVRYHFLIKRVLKAKIQ